MSKFDFCTDLLGALFYLLIMVFFGLLVNEVFFWLGFIGFAEVVFASAIGYYVENKEKK